MLALTWQERSWGLGITAALPALVAPAAVLLVGGILAALHARRTR